MIRLITILCALLLFSNACGVKGALQPKGKPEPLPPSELTLRQQGDEILLSWNVPTSNQDGTPLTDLAGFRIDLYTYQPDQYCQECRDHETIASISLDSPAPAIVLDNTVSFRDSGLAFGRGYRYRVHPFTESGRSGAAAEAKRVMQAPPAAPTAIRVEELDRGVSLFWNLSEGIQEKGELLGVNIYRGETGSAFSSSPVNPEPIKGNNFDSFGLTNETTYQYGLRTVIRTGELMIESELSKIIEATPRAGL